MKKLSVFDPVQCCSTGVCGPDADDELAQFASSLEWLKSKGVECLPMLIADGAVVKAGGYPSRDELASTFNLEASELAAPNTSSGCCG